MQRDGNAPDVVSVAQGKERKHADERVLERVDAPHEMQLRILDVLGDHVLDLDPEAHRLERLGGQVERVRADQLLAEQLPLLEAQDEFRDPQPPHAGDEVADRLRGEDFEDLGFLFALDAGEKRRLAGDDVDQPFFQVEPLDVVRLAAMQVDGPGMAFLEGAKAVVFADRDRFLTFPRELNDVGGSNRPNVHVAVGDEASREPLAPVARSQELSLVGEGRDRVEHSLFAFKFLALKGQLRRGTGQVRLQDFDVHGIGHGQLEAAAQEFSRVLNDVLVERIRVRNQDDRRFLAPPADPAPPLPGRHHGPGVPDENAKVEAPDVDAQLQGARRNDREERPVRKPLLDLAALFGEIPRPVGAHAFGKRRLHAGDAHVNELGHLPRLGEGDGLEARFRGADDESRGQARSGTGLGCVGFEKDEVAFGLGRPAFRDDVDSVLGLSGHLGRELDGVGDGRRKHDELRLAPVVAADALKAPQDLSHVTSEDPPVGVQLVDDDEAKALPERLPLGVVGKQGVMKHVRVGEQNVRRILADLRSLIRGGVAVVNAGAENDGALKAGEEGG